MENEILERSISREDLRNGLKQYFGFDQFKGNQIEIIESILAGRDTFVIMPTGGGKSLCYQLPALMLEGTAIIISPLIALMKNQVDSMRGYSQIDEVAHFLNSSLTKAQIKQVKDDITAGKTKLLYIAPETLTKDENLDFFRNTNISFVAVDEAHCISEWGHDFRPEYRRIRKMIDSIQHRVPVMALTATATPKVKSDILKNLNMQDESSFISSFNRENLFYEIRAKINRESAIKQIIHTIREMTGRSGIIYVQNRKTTEDIAEILNVNGFKAAPYHAGLDAKTRAKTQDDFLMEEIDIIVATIAFGMGIDKPDVRFVIHFDIPKSIENYYQETGRAGRDGLEGRCIAFYHYNDIQKLEKFLRDKPVAEREMGHQLLEEVVAYSETASCRRKFLLHYFGEAFREEDCHKMCDNCKAPKERVTVEEEMVLALRVIDLLNENYTIKTIVDFLRGNETQEMKDYGFDEFDLFGAGDDQTDIFWESVCRQAMLLELIQKDVEKYGVLLITEKGRQYMKEPYALEIVIKKIYDRTALLDDEDSAGGTAALDTELLKLLQNLRKTIAKERKVPPFVVFSDPSLEDMATLYPITLEDMTKVSGVSQGKAERYGKAFVELIAKYVDENEIERPTDFVVKSVANKSKVKVNIIQGIDRQLPLDVIAESNSLTMDELMRELDMIVNSGTKVDLDYYIEDNVDEYSREDIYDYFMQAETDDVEEAYRQLKEEDVTLEEVQLIRIKFLSEMAN